MASKPTDFVCWTAKHKARKVEHVRSSDKAARVYALTLWEQETWNGEESLVIFVQHVHKPVVSRHVIDFSIEVRVSISSSTTPKASELLGLIKDPEFDTPLRSRDTMPLFRDDEDT